MSGEYLNNINDYANRIKRDIEEQETRELLNASTAIRTIISRKDGEIRALKHDINDLKAKLYDEMCKHG